ncbi:hypothetical protein NIES2104_19810 [Leptolyngbya sp. NIES-2104]|nr:hypothetical protein NIES2104_19810 [Leptolyngbya sp. NIES-2104]
MLLTDLTIIGIHTAAYILYIDTPPSYWSIAADRSFGETFQYIKELWLVFSFAMLTRIRSNWLYGSLSLLCCYLFLDDLFLIHERVGEMIALNFNFQPMFKLRAIDYGELIVNAIAGSFFAVLIGSSYWRGSRAFRQVCYRVLVLLGGVVFCGIVLDVLHIIVTTLYPRLYSAFDLLEDGGEMLFMSVLCWYGISLIKQQEKVVQQPELELPLQRKG